MKNKHIAVLGTGSDVGKSIVAAGICRCLVDRGYTTAPFKAQNMSNNSGITPEGLEMGRAQIVQAEAARIPPHVDMNPILLKPTGDKQSQVVVNGRVHSNQSAMDYHTRKDYFQREVHGAFDRLADRYDRIVLEGAGSCAEVNLMPNDLVNFSMAEYADARVILTADIHRGGVFAQLVGTLDCIPQKYRDRVDGFIINRFRGDINLFTEGSKWIEEKTGKPVLGVLPWYTHFRIDAEDSVELEQPTPQDMDDERPAIAVIRLPRIANFTDFHALTKIPGLQTIFIDSPRDLHRFKAVILPGSKNTRQDLEWLKNEFGQALDQYHCQGGHLLGICGGYQMLGQKVADPHGLEGQPGDTTGLGLLPVETILKAPKTTTLSDFSWGGARGQGYEIHMGATHLTQPSQGSSLVDITTRNQTPCRETDGCMAGDGRVMGTYVHGFFDTVAVTRKWLDAIGLAEVDVPGPDLLAQKEKDYDLLKEHVEAHIDLSAYY